MYLSHLLKCEHHPSLSDSGLALLPDYRIRNLPLLILELVQCLADLVRPNPLLRLPCPATLHQLVNFHYKCISVLLENK
jgi:hypothetical protein